MQLEYYLLPVEKWTTRDIKISVIMSCSEKVVIKNVPEHTQI